MRKALPQSASSQCDWRVAGVPWKCKLNLDLAKHAENIATTKTWVETCTVYLQAKYGRTTNK
jgi:hypothetical protein